MNNIQLRTSQFAFKTVFIGHGRTKTKAITVANQKRKQTLPSTNQNLK